LGFLKHWRLGLMGIAVSGLAGYLIVTQINFDLFGRAWATARYGYVLPCIVFLLAGLVTRALRWQTLLSNRLSTRRAFSIMNVAYLLNNVLPLRIGEVARMFLATRAEPPVPVLQSASTIVVERLLDLLAVVMLLAVTLASGPLPEELQTAGLIGGGTALSGFLFLVFLARRKRLADRILGWFVARIPYLTRFHPEQRLEEILRGLEPLTKLSTLAQTMALTVLSWGLSVAAGYILMFAFYDRASWAVTCLYIAAAAFAIALPAAPANVGPYELSILLALNALDYGEPASTALAFAVMVHGVNVLVHSITGIVGFIQEGITLEQLSQGVREMQQNTSG
jgi:uncharacterized protein (TIRG00374 family)